MSEERRFRYVVVIGSCCSGDAVRPEGLGAIAEARLRLVLYQGRTTNLAMSTGPLQQDEYELTESGRKARLTDWPFRMITDEIRKGHLERLREAIGLADALILDNVSAFMFPTLWDPAHGRYFLKSWEWDLYVHPRLSLRELRLWEIPLQTSIDALRRLLAALYQRNPRLTTVFHIPRPSFNDGVDFADPRLRGHVDFYFEYSDRLYEDACTHFPRVTAVCIPARADPCHPSGSNPFRFSAEDLRRVRSGFEAALHV